MASSTSYFSLLLLTLLFSCHVDARDSQFFSKVSTNNNNGNELLPTKTEQQPLNKPEQQEPNFIPQNSGYGLYGHESGQLPPTTENLPYNKEFNPSSNNDQYYNNDAYVNPDSFSNSRNVQYNEGYPTNPRGNNNYYHGGNSMSNNIPRGIGETKLGVDKYYNNMYNNDKHGMSDTRFLDNGRYYYDTTSQNNYNLNNNNNVNVNSRKFESRNDQYYNNRENYGNSYRGQYGNNENSYEAKNSMEGYNQNQNQEEFQEDEQFMP